MLRLSSYIKKKAYLNYKGLSLNTEQGNNHVYSLVVITVSVCVRYISIVENWSICNTFIVKAMGF